MTKEEIGLIGAEQTELDRKKEEFNTAIADLMEDIGELYMIHQARCIHCAEKVRIPHDMKCYAVELRRDQEHRLHATMMAFEGLALLQQELAILMKKEDDEANADIRSEIDTGIAARESGTEPGVDGDPAGGLSKADGGAAEPTPAAVPGPDSGAAGSEEAVAGDGGADEGNDVARDRTDPAPAESAGVQSGPG